MVEIRRSPSEFDFQLRLTPNLLRLLFASVILIHLIVLRRATSHAELPNGETDVNSPVIPNKKKQDKAPIVIPYVVSMTSCSGDPFMEGAAVLKYSIHLASMHGNLDGRYDYKMYAIYHPDAAECAKSLLDLGYELIERPTPVKVEEIEGDVLRNKIENNGCCGSKELIKLEALTFTQYPIVVHLDMDVLILKPLDNLFDAMLDQTGDLSKHKLHVMWPNRSLPTRVDAFFTRDFNVIGYHRKFKPVQGGFLVLRPNMTVYDDLVAIVKKGNFDAKQGWGGKIGLFYGAMTVQGLFSYYYDLLNPGQVIDLNRCIYNAMSDSPLGDNLKDPSKPGRCKTGEQVCEDCRSREIAELVSMHFTICLKPWHCVAHKQGGPEHFLCRKMHHEWFRIRSSLEVAWGKSANGTGDWFQENFLGFCRRHGKKGYIPISRPFRPSFDSNHG